MKQLFFGGVLLTFVLLGCHCSDSYWKELSNEPNFSYKLHRPSKYYPQGGTAVPNDEPYPDMFFKNYGTNPFVDTDEDNLSTFGIDVDTASYSITRRYLNDDHLPPEEAVRPEEFINYFKYDYPSPQEAVGINLECAESKFGENCFLLKIGLKAKEIDTAERKNAILTFVIDTSGSMNLENRLGLVKKTLRYLVKQMNEGDKIGIVAFNDRAEVILKHSDLEDRDEILSAIEHLHAAGSTNAEDGLKKGYQLASKNFKKGYINRVILCSDGVANVGLTSAEKILKEIEDYAKKGIYLTTIGVGMGNYNDILLEKLADKGNGSYAYVDDIEEAKRIFVKNLTSTLQVVAKDVKVQVEFNPKVVRSYRLIGYENRAIKDKKFRDKNVDGGEMGAGHSVTALYELKLWKEKSGTAAKVFVRYKIPETNAVKEITEDIQTDEFEDSFEYASDDFKLAAAAAEFAEILKKSYWAQDSNIREVLTLAKKLATANRFKNDSDVLEFADLVTKSSRLMKNTSAFE